MQGGLAQYLLDAGVRLAEPGVWKAWDPVSAHGTPLRLRGMEDVACSSAPMVLRTNRTRVVAPMCLMDKTSMISQRIRLHGRWDDCAPLTAHWRRVMAEVAGRGAAASELGVPPLLLEIGGNIGACTLELLLSTDARVIAFEPSPRNLFHLTSTLLLASSKADAGKARQSAHDAASSPSGGGDVGPQRKYPQRSGRVYANVGVDVGVALRERAVVFPLAAADVATTSTLYADPDNSGNSVVGTSALNKRSAARLHTFNVTLRRVDDLLPARLSVPFIKIDAQGFECSVLRGMARLLRSRSVRLIAMELWPHGLHAQGCSEAEVLTLLRSYGFATSYSWAKSPADCRNPSHDHQGATNVRPTNQAMTTTRAPGCMTDLIASLV